MHPSIWICPALLLLADVVSSKAIIFSPYQSRSVDDYDTVMRRATLGYEGELERRTPTPSESLTARTVDSNITTTVATACESAISAVTTVTNYAGFSGCYNVLQWDPKTAVFQADLRLYQHGAASGKWTNISANDIMVTLNFPSSTLYKLLTKRSSVVMERRDDSAVQIQQFSLSGSFKPQFNVLKLNQTLLASLMVPQMMLSSTTPTSILTTNMTAYDTAWFVTGPFANLASQAAQVANPSTAAAAVVAAQPFVIPGRTFGIFPTGLIITSIWTFLFFVAFGLGTVGRIKARDIYRKRVAAVALRGQRMGYSIL